MLAMQRQLIARHRRRQAEINRRQSLETLQENQEQSLVDDYVRQRDQMQGSGVIAGMGFATYLG
jgi:hypothetical protein